MSKKFLTLIIAILLLLPTVAFGKTAVPWYTETVGNGIIQPTRVNGVEQAVKADYFIATSTTATSTFAGAISQDGVINGCTRFMVGTSTPDPGCALMVLSKVASSPSQSGTFIQALKMQYSNTTTFVPTNACMATVYNIAFNEFAGAGRDMGAHCANYDQAATSLGGAIRFYTRDHTSGLLTERGGWDGLGNFRGTGTTTRANTLNTPRAYFGGIAGNTTSDLIRIDSVSSGYATTTRFVVTGTGSIGVSSSTPIATFAVESTNELILAFKNTDTTIANGDVVIDMDFYTGDASGITNRNIGGLHFIACGADYAGVAAPTCFTIANQRTAGGAPTEAFRITDTGKAGLGTSTPGSQLQVAGAMTQNCSTNLYGQLELSDTTNPRLRLCMGVVTSTVTAGGAFQGTGMIQALTNGTGFNDLVLNPGGGDVGIGTSSPHAKFAITNTGTLDTVNFSDSADPDTTPWVIDANGNNGVGTPTPLEKFDVEGNISFRTGNYDLIFYRGGTEASNEYCSTASGNSGTLGCSMRQSFVINLDSDANVTNNFFAIRKDKSAIDTLTTGELFRVQEDGNVGVGTSTPPARITTYTTASTTSMLLDSVLGTGGCLMLSDMQGNGFTQVTAQAGVLYSKIATSLSTCN